MHLFMHNTAYLLLGGNMGNRKAFLSKALDEIRKEAGTIFSKSALYNSAAWPKDANQHDFLNQVVCVHTNLSAFDLLNAIHNIETKLGRIRKQKWEARIIDIDILFFNADIINTPTLTVPHPHLHKRRFVLVPLHEIASELKHPVLKRSIKDLLTSCPDTLPVKPA